MKDRSVSLKPKFNQNLEDNYNDNSRIYSHFQKRINDISKPKLPPLEQEHGSRLSSSHIGSIFEKSKRNLDAEAASKNQVRDSI